MRRSEQLLLVAQFIAGGSLAWGAGSWWLGSLEPLVVAVVLTLVVHVISWRVRGAVRGVWLTVLGLCGFLSKLDADLAARTLGDLRVPIVVGGSLLALAYGVLFEERERFKAAFTR